MPLFFLLIFAVFINVANAATSVDKQIKSQTDALKRTQEEIKKAEEKIRALENKESGVLKTISEIDNGLTQTREYLEVLQKRENTLANNIKIIEKEIGELQRSIDAQKSAMTTRIRDLYIHGKREEWELLYNLLKENENPKRKLYWVGRLLESDKNAVDTYLLSIEKQNEKRAQLSARQKEITALHENKAKEENKLQNQLLFQNQILTKVKKDRTTQEKAVEEFKKNQQTLAALITMLEKKRQAEIKKQQELARKKAEEEERKRKAAAKKSGGGSVSVGKAAVVIPKEVPAAIGPKCTPLKGEIISDYGYHINRDLDIKIMHLGTEIRGKKNDPIKAAAAGEVVMVGVVPGHGNSVIIDHAGSYYTVYGHLSAITVRDGEKVKNCQDIGVVGNVESTNGYKLFFQVYRGTQTQDPMEWLRR
ncbi:peptidase M23 [Fibrobacterales bacterium]|nr:peptidase M23 [Fibrobacterales bacterium]